MPNDKLTLRCSACGHENEPERVYCHECGQKLDRSLLPQLEEAKEKDSAAVRKRVKKMMSVKGPGPIVQAVKTFFLVVFLAALIAAGYLFISKPVGVPPKKSEYFPTIPPEQRWQQLMDAPQAAQMTYTEDEANYFLSKTIKPADTGIPGLRFERAFLRFEADTITVTAQRSIWGLDIYSSTKFAPRNTDAGVVFEPVGIYLGKLGLDPRIPGVAGFGLGVVKDAMKKQLGQLTRAKIINPSEVMADVDGVKTRVGQARVETKPLQ